MQEINDWTLFGKPMNSPDDFKPTEQKDRENEQLSLAADTIIPLLTHMRENCVQALIGRYETGDDLTRPVADLAATDNILNEIKKRIKSI